MATAAARGFETARLQASFTGIDRALYFAGDQPLSMQAALLARRGKTWTPGSTWRPVSHEDSSMTSRPDATVASNPTNVAARKIWWSNSTRLNNQIIALAGAKPPPEDVRQRLDHLNHQRLEVQGDLTQFEAQLVQKYKVAAGRVFRLDQIQSAAP